MKFTISEYADLIFRYVDEHNNDWYLGKDTFYLGPIDVYSTRDSVYGPKGSLALTIWWDCTCGLSDCPSAQLPGPRLPAPPGLAHAKCRARIKKYY